MNIGRCGQAGYSKLYKVLENTAKTKKSRRRTTQFSTQILDKTAARLKAYIYCFAKKLAHVGTLSCYWNHRRHRYCCHTSTG
jgi:ADP-glucose pyrophosphorylase